MSDLKIPTAKSAPDEIASFLFKRQRQIVYVAGVLHYRCAPSRAQLAALKRQGRGEYTSDGRTAGTWRVVGVGRVFVIDFLPVELSDPTEWNTHALDLLADVTIGDDHYSLHGPDMLFD